MTQSRIMNYDPVNKTVSYWYEPYEDSVRVDVCESHVNRDEIY